MRNGFGEMCIPLFRKMPNFRMLESHFEMYECINALKLVKYWCVFFCLLFLHAVVLLLLNMLVAGKVKYTHKALREKCQALEDLGKGGSNKDVAAKYNRPKNTLVTWVRIKNFLMHLKTDPMSRDKN